MSSYNADQLTQQIETTPSNKAQNLLALFDALDAAAQDTTIKLDPLSIFTDAFTAFYLKQAKLTTAENPDSLAAHLLLIAQKALMDQLSGRESESLHHAKTVAAALIQSQCKPEPAKPVRMVKRHWFTMAASVVVISIVGWFGWSQYAIQKQQPTLATNSVNPKTLATPTAITAITANQASEMYQKFEMMRNGTCRYLEAIQIPDEHKAVYIENVMSGKLPKNLKDLAIANAYLEKIQCSYTPMLMKKST